MDFFYNQESLTTVQWILRAVVSFVFLVLAAKLMGQRSISQLRFIDFIISMILGNIIAHPLSDEARGLKGPMITTVSIIVLYMFMTWLGMKWSLFTRFLDPHPLTLIKNGQILYKNLSKAKITIYHLLSEARKEKVHDLSKVALALWEPGGIISIFVDTPYQPLTPSAMNLKSQPFNMERPIIVDGKINKQLLREIGKDPQWLDRQMNANHAKINEVVLATVDLNGNLHIYSNFESN